MNWLTVLVSLFLKIRSDNSKLEIKQVFLFENNLLDDSNRCIEAGEGYNHAFKFPDEVINRPLHDIKPIENFYLDCDNNLRYVELSEDMQEKIFYGLNSSKLDKKYIRILLLTTDLPIVDAEEYKNYKGRKRNFEAHLWAEKPNDDYNDIINLKFDIDKSLIIYIKEKFKCS
ncbi:hypothetical protein NBO_28g0039 [Nosema bombycis CQ1]|uniref:Uncharacterized protein n=1 Tax=Nosema bombycis (strain CQ1 / CVCC 102059) TaxID=578461 RepID=R0MJM9_NOSB1|nr:hypothetical protein NBO_28g0039 [Nosema bombycis CQ1]|eukprot:EOB14400.1 hypothetical protein NBO_28g0039 [Nosema bombycis CQ1]